MSHFTNIKTQIKDLNALKRAAAELGKTTLENARARGWGGRLSEQAPLVIQLKGPYDVAVVPEADKTYALRSDLIGGHVANELGTSPEKPYSRLLQLYAVHKATIEARRKGHTVQRTVGKNGSIILNVTGA